MLRNKTAFQGWNILKYEIESIIYQFVPLKNKENYLERNTCQKKLCEGFIGVPERMKITQITKRHLMQLQLKLDNLKEAMSKHSM